MLYTRRYMVALVKGEPMASPLVRAALTTDELAALKAESARTGVSIARLVADAIRAHILTGKRGTQ